MWRWDGGEKGGLVVTGKGNAGLGQLQGCRKGKERENYKIED